MKTSAGFTLIELSIAIFIALIIFTVGFSAISTTMAVRKDSEARIGASEDSRMFFQTLERDLNGAYPLYLPGNPPTHLLDPSTPNWKPSDNLTQKLNGKLYGPYASDRLEFYTRIDHRGVADQLVFVRYFVNNNGHLCRQVVDSIDPSTLTPPSTDTIHHNPAILTSYVPPEANYLTDDVDAVFDQASALIINPLQWSADQKIYVTSTWPLATHVQVELMMYDLKGYPPKRSFIRTLELPVSLTNY
jgi:prepilin-type N-terminal cleavage/methylation domain-containing protein